MTSTTQNTYVHSSDIKAVRGTTQQVKDRIATLLARDPFFAQHNAKLVHWQGNQFDIRGGAAIMATMPLRRLCAWLEYRRPRHW